MSRFVHTLLKEARRQESRRTWALARRRGSGIRESIEYTLFRSRGFLVRRVSRTAREFLEAFGIALAASPLIALSSLKIWVIQLVLMSAVESIYQSLKGSILDFRTLNRKTVACCVALIVLLIQASLATVVLEASAHFEAVRLLFIVRSLGFLVESVLGSYYFDISAKVRVFISPKWAYLFVASSLASITIFGQLSPEWALPLIVVSHAALRIWDQWIGFAATRAVEKQYQALQKPLVSELQIDKGNASLSRFSRVDIRRLIVWSSLFTAPIILSLSLQSMGHSAGSILMWTLLSFAIRIVERPFRAYSVDMVDAILRHQWFLAGNALMAALRASLVLGISSLVVLCAIVGLFYTAYLPLIVCMLLVAILQRVLVNASGSLGLDKGLFWSSLVPRVAMVALYFSTPAENLPKTLIAFIGLELVSALAGAWRYRDLEVARRIESNFIDKAIALVPQPKYLPVHFLTAWKSLGASLTKQGLPQIHLSIQISETLRSPKRMEDFLKRLKDKIRPGDLIMAVSSQRLVAWMPGADAQAFKAVRQRLVLEFALEIEELSLISESEVGASFNGTNTKRELPTFGFSQELLQKFMSLELEAKEIDDILPRLTALTEDICTEGRWWMRDREGRWRSLGSTPASSQEVDLLFQLEVSSTGQVFLHKSVQRSHLETFVQARALRPFGALAAAYVFPVSSQSTSLTERLEALNEGLMRELVKAPAPATLELGPTRFKVVSTLAEGICRRHKIAFERGNSRSEEARTYISRSRRSQFEYWSLRLFLLLSLTGYAAGSQAATLFAEPKRGELVCRGDRPDRPLTLQGPGGSYHIVDIEFRTGPFVPAYLACARWISKLQYTSWYVASEVQGQSLLVPDNADPEARLVGSMRARLYEFCGAEDYCRVRFPFRLLTPLTLMRQFPESQNPILSAESCKLPQAAPSSTPMTVTDLRTHALRDLKNLRVSYSPRHTLTDAILEEIQKSSPDAVLVASTLNFSSEQLRLIGERLMKYPTKTLLLLYDMNPVTLEDDLLNVATMKLPQNLKLVPIFSSPQRRRYFHLKGLSSFSGEGRFYFSSANLKSNERFRTFDLGFSATQPAAANSLAALFYESLRENCETLGLLACSLEARYDNHSALRHLLEHQARESCLFLKTNSHLQSFASRKHPEVFLSTAKRDAVASYRSHIASAKESVDVSTHLLNKDEIIAELDAAQDRGVRVRVVVGMRGTRVAQDKVAGRFPLIYSEDLLQTESHTKALLVDGKRLLWGTGNLTHNGLVDSSEYFFFTEDTKLVEAYRRYLASFGLSNENTGSSECWVWIPSATALKAPEMRPLAEALESSTKSGFYRPRTPTLKSCLERGPARFLCSMDQVKQCLEEAPQASRNLNSPSSP
jgi:hypothetical protein